MYAGITTASFLFMLLYAAPFLGLPEIIAGARLCLPEQILLLAMMAIPADELLFPVGKNKGRTFCPANQSCRCPRNLCRHQLFRGVPRLSILRTDQI